MLYVFDVLYAVLYVRVRCFVVRGDAVSRRYINVCNSDVLIVNMYFDNSKFCVFMVECMLVVVNVISLTRVMSISPVLCDLSVRTVVTFYILGVLTLVVSLVLLIVTTSACVL